jgi:uncharacterized membrane protein YgcG
MSTQNGSGQGPEVQITPEHLQELFRRLPSAVEVMRMILLEAENAALKSRVEALENSPGTVTATAVTATTATGTVEAYE